VSTEYRYDVAFSFLASHLKDAEALARLLEPKLSTFVYAREKENVVLFDDGLERLSRLRGVGFESGARANDDDRAGRQRDA